jgi:glycosyltransferase involved in cell wall biosynthesis
MTDAPRLSLVIPAFDEAQRLPATLLAVEEFVAAQPYAVEVLVVDNHSRDATRALAAAAAERLPYLRVLAEPRQGKGAAVRTGMLAATGEYAFIADADLSMPLAEVRKFLPPALAGFDVAIGSREGPGAVRYDEPPHRHLMGRAFNRLVKLLAVRGIEDTQCGFKCFTRAAARDLFGRQTLDDWSFDVEILFLAQRLGYRVVEVPIHWYYREQSRIRPLRDALRMMLGVLRVRWNGWRGVYGPAAAAPQKSRQRGQKE